MKKTALEHFEDIKELEVADGPEITVKDLLPYKCEQVEKYLKALEIIKPYLKLIGNCLQVRVPLVGKGNLLAHVKKITNEEEFETLKEVLELI